MTTLNHDKLIESIEQKMEENGLNQEMASHQMKLAPGVFRRLRMYKKLYLETYLKIVNWLDKDLKEYLV